MNPLAVITLAFAFAAMPRIAIIIDDIGDREADGIRATLLTGPVALAFLPHAPFTPTLAERAHAQQKEVMLHLPLQALSGKALGPGAIMLDTSEAEFRRVLDADLASVPHVSGVNNHMGSLLTRHPGHMGWLMAELRARAPLFFVDSYTAVESVAFALAAESGVPATRRDVFLDTDPSPEQVAVQFERLLAVARSEGSALGIGHPYPATLELLERELPRLALEHGVELVTVRELIAYRSSAYPNAVTPAAPTR
ncbi:MAG: divergent polysaccharide deacetylase family protein [Gammaproteobacteria bacterium]